MESVVERDGVLVRPAVDADGPALAEIELATPIVVGDERVTYDRRPDYFGYSRLMEACDTVVAEIDGRPVAVHAAAFHEVRVAGERHVVNYIHHLRIHPDAQGKGLFSRLKEVAVRRYPPAAAASYVFVDSRNELILAGLERMGGTGRWPVEAILFELDMAALAISGAPAIEALPATADDAARIAELLDATHASKELWPGTSPEVLNTRLGRDPSQYAWSDLCLSDNAVVGLFRTGRTTRVIVEGPAGRSETRPVVVADHGGDIDEVVAMVQAQAPSLAAQGLDRVTMFAADGSDLAKRLESLSVRQRRFEFWMTNIPPPGIVTDLYIDPIYF